MPEPAPPHGKALHRQRGAQGHPGEPYVAAYRKWMRLPQEKAKPAPAARVRKPAVKTSVDRTGAIELVVLSVKKLAVRCKTLAGERLTLRAKRFWDLAPGEIVPVRPNKHWTYADNPYLSGEIESRRIDATALGLTLLKLESRGIWDPAEEPGCRAQRRFARGVS